MTTLTPTALPGPPEPEPAAPPVGPVAAAERIVALDVVRGLAVLGILVMNIVEFGLPLRAYTDPVVAGGTTGADRWTWFVQEALFDGRMRALFSMLFGAGLVLIADRMERSGRGRDQADLLLRRCLWLVPFGLVHRFALQWTGDILYQYGLFGVLAVAFRRLRPRAQIVTGLLFLTAFVPIEGWRHHQLATMREQAATAQQRSAAGEEVSAELQTAQKTWERLSKRPDPADNQAELAAMRGDYPTVFWHRWNYHHTFQSAYVYYHFVFDVLGMLLIGMGLCRTGFFTAGLRPRVYWLCLVGGLGAAGASFALAAAKAAGDFDPTAIGLRFWHGATYPYLRLLGALGWAAALLLLVRAGALRIVTAPLAHVGRMAFSNYVLQTVCCTLFFFGYGLGKYGELSRAELMLVWAAVSGVQIAFSLAWLRWFRYGPLEWAWRSLTWWQRQPLRR